MIEVLVSETLERLAGQAAPDLRMVVDVQTTINLIVEWSHPNWIRVCKEQPPEIIATIESAWLSWLLIPTPQNRENMVWLWGDFISPSEGHPRNKELREYDYPSSYDDDYAAFYYAELKPCVGRIALASGPLFVRFTSHEIKHFQKLVWIFVRLWDNIFDISNVDQIFAFSMSEPL